ncbi:MAG: hypothetical protein ABRQ24_08605 [Syntrophomonadaceae bacterium]
MRACTLHISSIIAIGLAMYFPGLDIVLALVYVYLVWKEGEYCRRRCSRTGMAVVAILWQLPGYLLASSILLSVESISQFAYYFIFILELWDTPLLPLLSLLPAWTLLDRPLYYYLLFLQVPLLSLCYYTPALIKRKPKSRSAGSI